MLFQYALNEPNYITANFGNEIFKEGYVNVIMM